MQTHQLRRGFTLRWVNCLHCDVNQSRFTDSNNCPFLDSDYPRTYRKLRDSCVYSSIFYFYLYIVLYIYIHIYIFMYMHIYLYIYIYIFYLYRFSRRGVGQCWLWYTHDSTTWTGATITLPGQRVTVLLYLQIFSHQHMARVLFKWHGSWILSIIVLYFFFFKLGSGFS